MPGLKSCNSAIIVLPSLPLMFYHICLFSAPLFRPIWCFPRSCIFCHICYHTESDSPTIDQSCQSAPTQPWLCNVAILQCCNVAILQAAKASIMQADKKINCSTIALVVPSLLHKVNPFLEYQLDSTYHPFWKLHVMASFVHTKCVTEHTWISQNSYQTKCAATKWVITSWPTAMQPLSN